MSIVSNNYYQAGNPPKTYGSINGSTQQEGPYSIPRFRLGAQTASGLRGQADPTGDLRMIPEGPNGLSAERMAIGQQQSLRPQAYLDQSADTRDGLASFFSAGSRFKERDAYTQNHVSVSGIPGVVHMAVLDAKGDKIPHAPFSWGGRSYHCDSLGRFTILERSYFQNTVSPPLVPLYPLIHPMYIIPMLCLLCNPYPIYLTHTPQISAENERTKYVTQLISLVVGAPASNVIAMFGMEFYKALGPGHSDYSTNIYGTYLSQAGFSPDIIDQKCKVFGLYADADASPEVFFHPYAPPLCIPDLLYPLNVRRAAHPYPDLYLLYPFW